MESVVSESETTELTKEQKANLETGRISWVELQPHFARGSVIVTDANLDLVKIAAGVIEDNSAWISKLMQENQLRKPDMVDAEHWHLDEREFWAVVVAPWVLVQEIPID
ncbi:MAG: DUF2288 domain-containing protein [bacterium]